MKHKPEAVEDMARRCHRGYVAYSDLIPSQWERLSEYERHTFRSVATYVLDALVPEGFTPEDISWPCHTETCRRRVHDILDGTAKLGKPPTATGGEE